MRKIMRILSRLLPSLFPNDTVKELIAELDKLGPLFGEGKDLTGSVGYSHIKVQVKEHFIKHQKEWAEFVKEEKQQPREVCLFAMVNTARDDLAYGHDHIYRGVLSMIGEGKFKVWTIASNELVKMGKLTNEKYDKVLKDVKQEIREVG
jgi:hypothetical protein